MSARDLARHKTATHHSGRKYVDRKIRRLSALIGVAGVLLTVLAYCGSAYHSFVRWRNVNVHALSEIDCVDVTCDTSLYSNDIQWDNPDYIVDTRTRYVIDVAAPTGESRGRFPPLDYSDTTFIGRFRHPTTLNTPDGEVWRMYSKAVAVGENRSLEVIVGDTVKAPSKAIEIPNSLIGDVDVALKREADKIGLGLSEGRAVIHSPRRGFSVDGFQAVDPSTGRVVEQGEWLPVFFPGRVPLPAPGIRLYIYSGSLYGAETDTNGRLLATSFTEIGGVQWIVSSCAAGFLFTFVIARLLSRRFLRNYFAVIGIRVPTLEQSLRDGEGQNVEFKRGLSDSEARSGSVEEEVLKSIAAFANTNDGAMFIGVDDAGHVKGMGLGFTQKDRLERKIRQLVRTRIRPTPPVQITFEDCHGLVVAKIAVARGEAPPYMIGGTIHVRHGSSDVQAHPEDVVRLVSQYA